MTSMLTYLSDCATALIGI